MVTLLMSKRPVIVAKQVVMARKEKAGVEGKREKRDAMVMRGKKVVGTQETQELP
jgi:hypothetical protein